MKALAALACLCAVAHAETLRGTIVDRTSKQPVGGATIAVGSELAASNDDGTFAVTLPRGRYTVEVTADWLEPTKLPVVLDRDLDLTIEVIEKAAPSGETIEVVESAVAASVGSGAVTVRVDDDHATRHQEQREGQASVAHRPTPQLAAAVRPERSRMS